MKCNKKRVAACILAFVMAAVPSASLQAEEIVQGSGAAKESEFSVDEVQKEETAEIPKEKEETIEQEPVGEEKEEIIPEETKPEETEGAEAVDTEEETEDVKTEESAEEINEEIGAGEINEEREEIFRLQETAGQADTEEGVSARIDPKEILNGAEYQIDAEEGVEGSTAMFKVTACRVSQDSDGTWAVITLSGTGYDMLYMGTKEEAAKADTASCIHFVPDDSGRYTYRVPVSMFDAPVQIAAHSIKKDLWYDRSLTFSSKHLVLNKLPEGGYDKVTVGSDNKMFKVTQCRLTSQGGKMEAVITLSGTGYDKLYMGTAKEAQNADISSYIPYIPDDKGAYTFTIPVSALHTAIPVAAHAVKSGKWMDRSLTFTWNGEGEPLEPGEDQDPEKPESPPDNPGIPGNTGNSGNNGNSGNTGNTGTTGSGLPVTESRYESDLSGSTGRVNNTTSLADGVYTPDRFTWSGGTGRVQLSCSKLTVSKGQAYATITFSSGSYGYVKANGNRYYASHSGNTSTFTIPVRLNENNTIIGMTTAMSSAHEVTYSIFIYLGAALEAEKAASAGAGLGNNDALDESAPKIPGLVYQEEVEMKYAEYAKIFQYEQGITLLEIDITSDTKKTVSPAEGENTLYKGNVAKYLIIPEGAKIPAGLEKEAIVIRKPADKVYAASDEILEQMQKIDVLDKVAAVACKEQDCKFEKMKEGMQEDRVRYAGAYDSPDLKELLRIKCGLVVLPSKVLIKEEGEGSLEELTEKYTLLKIPVIVDRSQDEKEVLAQKEWIKVYGVLFGCEEKADEVFEAMVLSEK